MTPSSYRLLSLGLSTEDPMYWPCTPAVCPLTSAQRAEARRRNVRADVVMYSAALFALGGSHRWAEAPMSLREPAGLSARILVSLGPDWSVAGASFLKMRRGGPRRNQT